MFVSLLVGGTVTAVSLPETWPPGEPIEDCARWVSLGIWSGIGIASLGTLSGILIVREAQRPRVQLSFGVDPQQHGGALPRAGLVGTF